jgi:hypothetical protein
MFRALLAHSQQALHKQHYSQLPLYARNIPNYFCVAPPEDEQIMLETYRDFRFSINWMKSASRWFHYTDILWCTVSKTLRLPCSQVHVWGHILLRVECHIMTSYICTMYLTSCGMWKNWWMREHSWPFGRCSRVKPPKSSFRMCPRQSTPLPTGSSNRPKFIVSAVQCWWWFPTPCGPVVARTSVLAFTFTKHAQTAW